MKTNIGLVEYVKSKLGCPYVWGKIGQVIDGKQCFDCAGLIKGYYFNMDSSPNTYNVAEDYSADELLSRATEKGSIDTLPLNVVGLLVHMKGHVGVYIGNGRVIEARGKAYGVVETKLEDRAWKCWSKCIYLEYVKGDNDMKIETVAEAIEFWNSRGVIEDMGFWLNSPMFYRNIEPLLIKTADYARKIEGN